MASVRTVEFGFSPLPVHIPFHSSPARIKVSIGGVGSGKTAALCMEAIRFALGQPGSYMLLTRRTVPDLRRSTEKELMEVMPPELEKACEIKRLGGHIDSIIFPGGSHLLLAGMEDWNKHKALADDQPVLTPAGWRRISGLRAGDDVIGGDGRPTRVLAVTPQGCRQMYRVSVADGGSVECDADHLWSVRRGRTQRTVRTSELRTARNMRDTLPSLPPVNFGREPGGAPVPIEPYVLGALLGDGGLTQRQISFTCAPGDAPEIVGALRHYLGEDAVRKLKAPLAYSIRKSASPELYAELEREGLMGRSSHDKFIPERYLRADPAERLLLLKGLMDTDGSAGPTQNRYVTVSRALAEGVVELARSLGCGARLRDQADAYVVNVTPPDGLDVFQLQRKVVRQFSYSRCGGRAVSSVEPTRMAFCTCIEVEHESKLFVTKDYMLTHNSMNLAWIGIDEGSEQTRTNIEGILTRLRQSKPLKGAARLAQGQRMVNQMVIASNPAGQDHLYEMFVDPKTRRADSSIHLSTPMDNPYLPPAYLDMLLQMPAAYIRRFVEALADDEPVLTPSGWRPIGGLAVGDYVVGADGRPTRVEQVLPQGTRPLFAVQIGDGTTLRADADHKWSVWRRRSHGAGAEQRTVSTSGLRPGDRLPALAPVEPAAPATPLLDPYVLGVLLAEGALGAAARVVQFAANDDFIVDAVRTALGENAVASNKSTENGGPGTGVGRTYYLRHRQAPHVREALTSYGLVGTNSYTKFVPAAAFTWSAADRLSLLQGMMDGDGTAARTSNSYCSVSKRLAHGLRELALSLGCRATVHARPYGDSDKYVVQVAPSAGTHVFRLPRKRHRQHVNGRTKPAARYVRSVVPDGDGAATCINVAAPDGLFVARDYVVTHNCRFDAAAGRVYPEWGWSTHVLPRAAPGTYGQLVWMSMDPGILNPTAGLWAEVDRARGRIVAVAEYQEPGRSAPEHAAAWRRIEKGLEPTRVVRRVADPSITKRDQGTSMELSDIYQRLGFNFERGPVRDDVRIPALANAIAAGQFMCTEACPRLYEQILNARWEDQLARLRDLGDFKEKMKKGNDHLHDTAQYLASMHVAPVRQGPAAMPPPPKTAEDVEEAWHKARRERLRGQATGASRLWVPGDGVIV